MNMTMYEWIIRGETGVSSKTMWSALIGVVDGNVQMGLNFDIPHDSDDFRRCLMFYEQCGLTRKDLDKIGKTIKWWKPFTDNWDKLVSLYKKEKHTGKCPKLYDYMQELANRAKILDGWVNKGPGCWEKQNQV